jgi:hypothetical protein
MDESIETRGSGQKLFCSASNTAIHKATSWLLFPV